MTMNEPGINLPEDLLSKLGESIQSVHSPESSILNSVMNSTERYTDRKHLAEGAMKVILECHDAVTGRKVAMAFPKHFEEKESVEQFLREARILTALDHPNIIPVYDIGVDADEKPYFTMKLIHGESLEEMLKKYSKGRDEDLASRLRIFERICEAMAFSHSKGIVHLDLKPDNVQISSYGEVQVCDWGLAKLMQDVTDTSSTLLDDKTLNFAEASLSMVKEGTRGTPGFMAPEQIGETNHEHDRRTDIYSLGAILYSLLTFKKPAEGSLQEILDKTKKGEIKSPDFLNLNCSGSLSAICMKALATNPKDRYEKVDELLNDLHAYMGGFATNAEDASFLKQFGLFYSRNKTICNLSVFTLVLVTVLSLVFIGQLKEREQQALSAERKATSALNSFLEEQKKSQVLTDGIDTYQLVRSANHHYSNLHLDKAKNFARAVLLLDPVSEDANNVLGKSLCVEQKFNEALPYLQKGSKDAKMSLLPIAKKYADHDGTLSAAQLAEELNEFTGRLNEANVKYKTKHFSWNRISHDIVLFLGYSFRNFLPVEGNISLLEKVMKLENQESEIHAAVTKDVAGELTLDVSRSKDLKWTYIITYLPIQHLDLGPNVINHRKPLFKIDIHKSPSLKSVTLSQENKDLIEALKREEKEVIVK